MTRAAAQPKRRRWLWGAAALAGIVVLVQLGNWQIQRRAWKHDLIARVDARVHVDPVAAPPPADWPQITRVEHEYRRVTLQGRYLHPHEAQVQATTELGAGYWVLTPLQQADGTRVWVNRGFVPPARRDPDSRVPAPGDAVAATRETQETRITGLLRLTEPHGAFLRKNDPEVDRWHSRDIAALTRARNLPATQTAPYFVDAQTETPVEAPAESLTETSTEAPTNASGVAPIPGLTVIRFADNHLVYALTWYGLALGLAAALIVAWRVERRRA